MKSTSMKFRTTAANNSGVVEADTTSKHGRNPKSQTSRRNTVCFSLLLISVFCVSGVFGPSKKEKAQVAAWEEELKWKVDGNDVIFEKVIRDIPGSKDEIFTNVLNFFAKFYNQSKEVIQQKDKDAGIVIGKGVFTNIDYDGICGQRYDHMISVEVKETRVRVRFTCSQYTDTHPGISRPYLTTTLDLTNHYPFGSGLFADKFIWLCEEINRTFIAIEEDLKKASSLDNADW